MNSKFCKKCNQEKPLSSFPGGKRGKGSTICEPCRAINNEVSVSDFAKPSNCRDCDKPIIASGKCYSCATGSPRVYTPEWVESRKELKRLMTEQEADI